MLNTGRNVYMGVTGSIPRVVNEMFYMSLAPGTRRKTALTYPIARLIW